MNFADLKNIEKPLLFLNFGQISNKLGLHEIEMNFMVLKDEIKPGKTIIEYFNYFKVFSTEILTVWAPYKIIGESTMFDLYKKGKVVSRLCDSTNTKELYFNAPLISYQLGLNGIFMSESNSLLDKILSNQHFAWFKLPTTNEYWITPCSEIYTSYFGKIQSAILASTFEGIEIYNEKHTKIGEEELYPTQFIKLRKQFTKASVKFAYRLRKDDFFREKFNVTRAALLGDDKMLFSMFPFKKSNFLKVNYVKLKKGVNLVVQIKSIKSDFEFPARIEYDTDNSEGEDVSENTKKLETSRVNGISVIEDPDLPIINGPVNGILNPLVVNIRPNEDIESVIEIEKITKDKKETICKRVYNITQLVDYQSYGSGGSSNSNTIERSHESKNENNAETNYSFENLESIINDLTASRKFKYVDYYQCKSSHNITDKLYFKGKTNWPYLEKNLENIWKGFRKMGLIELKYEEYYLYILEIQKRRDAEKYSLGIIFTHNFSILSEEKFKNLKEGLILCNGSLQNMFSSMSKAKNISVLGKALNHTTGEVRMVDRIISNVINIVT